MDELEKKIYSLPKQKLGARADLKIKFKLYYLIMIKKLEEIKGWQLFNSQVYKFSAAFILLVLVVFSGASIYAYADSGIAPGHKLYQLKQVLENVEEKFTFTPAAKVELYEKFSQRRLEEALHLSQSNLEEKTFEVKEKINKNIEKTIDDAITDFNNAVNANQEIKQETKPSVDGKKIRADENKKTEYLNRIAASAQANKNESLVKKISEAKKAFAELGKIRGKILDENKAASIRQATTSAGQIIEESDNDEAGGEKKTEQKERATSTDRRIKRDLKNVKFEDKNNKKKSGSDLGQNEYRIENTQASSTTDKNEKLRTDQINSGDWRDD